jgi:hypothetical protein
MSEHCSGHGVLSTHRDILVMGATIAVARLGGGAPCSVHSPFPLSLLLGVFPYSYHTVVMTVHAVDALTGFGKDKLVDAILADLAFEAVGVI